MPKVGQPSKQQVEMEEVLAEQREFAAGFKRSRKGNLWHNYDGMTLTVFRRDDGWYAWCIADSEETRFSRGAYEEEGDAIFDLGKEVGVAEWYLGCR